MLVLGRLLVGVSAGMGAGQLIPPLFLLIHLFHLSTHTFSLFLSCIHAFSSFTFSTQAHLFFCKMIILQDGLSQKTHRTRRLKWIWKQEKVVQGCEYRHPQAYANRGPLFEPHSKPGASWQPRYKGIKGEFSDLPYGAE